MLDDGLKQQLFEALSETTAQLESFMVWASSPEKHAQKRESAKLILFEARRILDKARSAGLALAGEDRRTLQWSICFFLHDSKIELLIILTVFTLLGSGIFLMLR